MRTSILADQPTMTSAFRLGQLLIDPVTRNVSVAQLQQSCEPKVFDLLLYFCRHQGEIVSRDMLLSDIWQGRVVSDNAINRKIYQLRKFINELDPTLDYIETIPKFGYRLTQTIEPLPPNHPDNKAAAQQTAKSHIQRWLLLLCILLIFGWILWAMPQEPDSPSDLVQLTTLPGVESDASLSPDGTKLLFSHTRQNRLGQSTALLLKDLKTDTLTELTQSNAHDIRAVWHPDGKKIAFVRLEVSPKKQCHIYLLSLEKPGTKAQQLVACALGGLPTLSFSDIPNQLLFADRSAKNTPYIIYSLDTENRVKQQLTQPQLSGNLSGDYFIKGNQDGSKQVVLRYLGSDRVEVSVYQSSPFERMNGFELKAHINDIAWSDDGQWFYYQSEQHISRVAADGLQPQKIFHLGRAFRGLSYSAKQNALLLTTFASDTDIWQYGNSHSSFIGSTKKDFRPRFANNSENIAFLSDRGGSTQFWLKAKHGGVKRISDFPFNLSHSWFAWSADDQHLLFDHQDQVYSYHINSGTLTLQLSSTEKPYFAAWSNDGQSLFYGSTKSGQWQIWQLNISDKTTRQLTFNGGYSVQQNSADGKLYFSKYHHDGLWRLNDDGSETQILDDFSLLNWLNWQIKDNGVIYAKPGEAIYRFDLATQHRHKLMGFTAGAIHDYSVSPQTQEIVYSKQMSQSGDVLMLKFISK